MVRLNPPTAAAGRGEGRQVVTGVVEDPMTVEAENAVGGDAICDGGAESLLEEMLTTGWAQSSGPSSPEETWSGMPAEAPTCMGVVVVASKAGDGGGPRGMSSVAWWVLKGPRLW